MTETAQVLPPESCAPRELYVRSATRNGREVVRMTALDYGDACVVDVRVTPQASEDEQRSYNFGDARQATAFVTEAVEALIYLGCEIHG